MNVKKTKLLSLILPLLLGLALCEVSHAQEPLTYPKLLTALNAKLPRGVTKAKLIKKLIADVENQGIDKPLTADREDDLRQAGATDELIAAIRSNSPPLPTPVVPKPTPIYLPPMSELLKNAPKQGDVRKNSIGIEIVWLPPGDFMMGAENGDSDEKPVHLVKISQGFWIGKYEVSQSQYESVMGTNPSRFKECADCPVEQVSWDDAKLFISQLNAKNDGFVYNLPTEAQWEYAARSGIAGDYAGNLNDMAWFSENSGSKTHTVGTKRPNSFGLYDMHGNVWEWCEDIFNENGYRGLPTDGSANLTVGDSKSRVIRGGSWYGIAYGSRSANRLWFSQASGVEIIGFRVVARVR